jgi:lipopolysaccharide biosynthesis glycosyltransferase
MSKTSDKVVVPVFFASDDNYAPLLHVAIESIRAHATPQHEYRIYVLYDNLNEDNRKLLEVFNKDNMTIECVNMKETVKELIEKLFTRDYYSHATYFRVFIPTMFPQYDKALYLDCDIALNADAAELFNIDIGDNYVGAVTCEVCNTTPPFDKYVEEYIGSKLPLYFNAGILSINLDMWRKVDMQKNFFDLMDQVTFAVIQDQDYLNVLCRGRTYFVPFTWNKWSNPANVLPVEQVKLVHYNLTYRPWKTDDVQYGEVFWKHAKNTVVYQKVLDMKAKHTQADAEKHQLMLTNLAASAVEHINRGDETFRMLLHSGKVKLWGAK